MSPAAIVWDEQTVRDRSTLQMPSGCWRWGRLQRDGYALIHQRGVAKMAHRFVYELLVGPIPDGAVLDHVCHTLSDCKGGTDCPHRACVNPDHLEPVTADENYRRGRHFEAVRGTTHCPKGHEYQGRNVIRYQGRRYCRTCMYARRKAARSAS